jgi:hypothetical protein
VNTVLKRTGKPAKHTAAPQKINPFSTLEALKGFMALNTTWVFGTASGIGTVQFGIIFLFLPLLCRALIELALFTAFYMAFIVLPFNAVYAHIGVLAGQCAFIFVCHKFLLSIPQNCCRMLLEKVCCGFRPKRFYQLFQNLMPKGSMGFEKVGSARCVPYLSLLINSK